MKSMRKIFLFLGLAASLIFSAAASAAQDSAPQAGAQGAQQGGAPAGMQQGGMQGGMPMTQGGGMQQGTQGGMQAGMMQGGMMQGGGMPMMMDMSMMHGMMSKMMSDMQNGKMMDMMMKGCMMQASMSDMMRQNKSFSDRAFLSAMVPHHEAAMQMANAVLKSGKDAQVKKWAQAVVADQGKEIVQMKGMLAPMGGEDAQASAAMKDSMRSMMQPMMQGSATMDPDSGFVSMMIGHHAMAVEMAAGAAVASQDPNVVKLANSIAHKQLDEIAAYKAWLKTKGQ